MEEGIYALNNPTLEMLDQYNTVDITEFQHEFHAPQPVVQGPFLQITEQPKQRGFRFRYHCEGPSHGGLPGYSSERHKKTFPTVRICNHVGIAKVVVHLVTENEPYRLHPHRLVGKNSESEPISCNVGPHDMTAMFPSLGVLHVTKKSVASVLEKLWSDAQSSGLAKIGNITLENSFHNINPRRLTDAEIRQIKNDAQQGAKTIDLSVVRLMFTAYLPDSNGLFTRRLSPVFSNPIYDSKAPNANNLKIVRMDRTSGCVTGGDEVYLLCDKVQKEDIQVRFYSDDWEAWGNFGPTDVHKQYAIVFKTPRYCNVDISKSVTVFVQLRRKSDQETSEAKPFIYYPQKQDKEEVGRKRQKTLPHFSDHLGGGGGMGGGMGGSSMAPGASGGGGGGGATEFYGGPNMGSSTGGSFNVSGSGGSGSLWDGCSGGYPFQTNVINMNFSELTAPTQLQQQDLPGYNYNYQCLEFDGSAGGMQGPEATGMETFEFIDPPNEDEQDSDDDLQTDAAMEVMRPPTQTFPTPSQWIKGVDQFKASPRLIPVHPGLGSTKKPLLRPSPQPARISADVQKSTQTTEQRVKDSGVQTIGRNLETAALRLAERTAKAQKDYAITGDPRILLAVQRHLTGVQDDSGDAPLHLAVIHQKPLVVQHLLQVIVTIPHQKIVNLPNDLKQTPLHLAVITRQSEITQMLLRSGADPMLPDRHGNLVVHTAVANNDEDTLRVLIEWSGDAADRLVDSTNYEGFYPVHVAVMANSLACLKMLVNAGADVNRQELTYGRTALHCAVESENLSLAAYLADQHHTEVDTVTYDGNTPLHVAAGRGLVAMVALLVQAGADAHAESFEVREYTEGNDYASEEEEEEDGKRCEESDSGIGRGITPLDLAAGNKEVYEILCGKQYVSRKPSATPAADVRPVQISESVFDSGLEASLSHLSLQSSKLGSTSSGSTATNLSVAPIRPADSLSPSDGLHLHQHDRARLHKPFLP